MLEDLKPNKRSYPCKVRTIKDGLELEDRIRLESAMRDKSFAAWALHTALKDKGIYIGDKTIRRHRDGDCSCSRLN